MTKIVVNEVINEISNQATEAIKKRVREMISKSNLSREIAIFLSRCDDQLLALSSQSPSLFGWLEQFMRLLGM